MNQETDTLREMFKDFLSCFENFESSKEITRTEKILPKLTFVIIKNRFYIQNLKSFCKLVNRTEKEIIKFFSQNLGCSGVERHNHYLFKIKTKMDILDATEQKLIAKELLCNKCSSLETVKIKDKIHCLACSNIFNSAI